MIACPVKSSEGGLPKAAFKFEFPAACWSETEIPTFGAARDEFK
jgi:hypothetical protein